MIGWKFGSTFALFFLAACGEPREQVIARCNTDAIVSSAVAKAGDEALASMSATIACARRAGYHYQPKLLCGSVSAADPACYSSPSQRFWEGLAAPIVYLLSYVHDLRPDARCCGGSRGAPNETASPQ
jgi:hypothetical protein